MSKIITIDAATSLIKSDASIPATVTIKNIWEASQEENNPLAMLDPTGDKVFNTGASSVGDPHADEDVANAGKNVIADTNPWNAKHIAAVQLFGCNSFVYLLPGDTLKLAVTKTNELLHYAMMKSDLLEVKVASDSIVTADTNDHADEKTVAQEEFKDKTTGIGDLKEEKTPDDGE